MIENEEDLDAFCTNNASLTGNSLLILNIIREYRTEQCLPPAIRKFLAEVTLPVPACGIIQLNESSSIKILKSFLRQEKDLRCGSFVEDLNTLRAEMPHFWNLINNICVEAKSNFLPVSISVVCMKLLAIRKQTFQSMRQHGDYIQIENPKEFGVEHPLQFYPFFPLISFPKKYSVSGKEDSDFCSKTYPRHKDFTQIFTIGCTCELNVSYGFELQMGAESARSIFKLQMCRKFQMDNNGRKKLRGWVYDNACNAHRYCLNRDAEEFQYTKFIIDGVHFSGHKNCSKSYDFMQYKPFTKLHKDGAKFSQGREQMHAVLKKLSPSLRQQNYPNFMRTMICFFAIRNLINMKRI